MRVTFAIVVAASAGACANPTVAVQGFDASIDVNVVADVTPTVDAPTADAMSTASHLRVLFVGNSYTYVNDLPGLVAHLAAIGAAAGHGPVIETDSVAVGGATLRNQWETNDAPMRVAMGAWNAVVLQEQSVTPVLNFTEFRTYGVRFGMLVTGSHARPVYYATWPRRAGDTVYDQAWSGGTPSVLNERLDLAITQVSTMVGGTVAHVGNAWMAALRSEPAIDLYADDGSHPTPAGTWIAACVIYRALTGVAAPPDADGSVAGVTASDARALRELVAVTLP